MNNQNKLSLFLATVLGINAVVGSGIFTMPIVLVRMAGPAGILTILLATLCVMCIALAFARLAFLLPQEGGFYIYVSAWAGRALGMVASFFYFVGLTIALGILV